MTVKSILRLAGILTLAAAVSCQPKEKKAEVTPVTTKIALQSYRSASGAHVSPVFKASDSVKLTDAVSGESDIKSPVNPGSNLSTFLFTMKNVAQGDPLVGIWPADAPVSLQGKSLTFTLPDTQDGTDITVPMIGWTSHTGDSYAGNSLKLEAKMALVRASIQKGAYSVQKAVLKSNGGENLAGNVTVDLATGACSASSSTITVTFQTPLDCRVDAKIIPFFVAPGTLNSGVTVTFYTEDGQQIESKITDPVTLAAGTVYNTVAASSGRTLIAAGSTKVYVFDENLARQAMDYMAGLIWEWNSSVEAAKLSRPDHIDDAKPVYDNKKMLVTSSFGWCGLVDIASKNLDFFATGLTNAHSAEILPDDRIVVACSEGFVALYDKNRSNAQIANYPLGSAHGVVWNAKKQRLYAIGGSTLQIYKLNDAWKTDPALVLEKTVSSSGFVTGMHDMTAVDENTLIIGGNKLAFFDVNTESFTSIPAYSSVAGFKSVNYNAATGEMYYTYAWQNYSEGSYTWSSHWIRYTDNLKNSFSPSIPAQGVIRVEDINMYKVRVFNW